MSMRSYGDGRTFVEATIHGALDNAPLIYPDTDWITLTNTVTQALRGVLSFTWADFHIVYRGQPHGTATRKRWGMDARLDGPTLAWAPDTTGGASDLSVIMIARDDLHQYSVDPEQPMPGADQLADIQIAVLARHLIGAAPVQIPRPDEPGEMLFTPHEISYTRDLYTPIRAPYADPLCGYTFSNLPPNDDYRPELWVVPAGTTVGMKVSRCLDFAGQRWDDPDEPTPEFDELPPPTQDPA